MPIAIKRIILNMKILLKRVYESASDDDGFRVLVDRLWPRGISKESAKVDLWLKEVGPSNELRKWFGHDPAKFDEFTDKYKAELSSNLEFVHLTKIANEHPKLTLIYSAKDQEHNQAVVLRQLLTKQ